MLIRTATYDDTEALRDYAAALFAEDLPGIFRREVPTLEQEREFIALYLEPVNSTMLVAEAEGQIVGMIGFKGYTLAEEAHSGEFGLSVAREHRGTGVGTALIEALIEWAPAHGISRIEVCSWSNNPRATALYGRCGFEEEGRLRRGIERDGEKIDVIIMGRLL